MAQASTSALFDWSLFLPGYSPLGLFSAGVTDTVALTALFVWVVVLIFCVGALWVLWRVIAALRAVRFLQQLTAQAMPQKLASQRRELRNRAAQRRFPGQFWLEYDATWVESADGQHIYQTVDAAEFFNLYTLAGGITENRLILAIPGILTAFGILGTFVGLQIGLSTLDLSSPQVLTQSIIPLVQGAAVAFSTSVWGIVGSVLFNFYEKFIEQLLRRQTQALCSHINSLFPLHSPEQTLLNIERSSVEAENALKGLAEQIGAKMQEALLDVPAKIQAGVEAAMLPAMEKLAQAAENLANKQSDTAQQALAAMIEKFVGSVSASGETSRLGLETASARLSESLAAWNAGMDGFLKRLENRSQEFDQQVGTILEQGRELRGDNAQDRQQVAAAALNMQAGGEAIRQAAQEMQKFGKEIQQAAKLLGDTQLQTARLADASAQRQQETSELLAKIAQSLDQANEGLRTSSQSLQESAQTAQATYTGLASSQQEFLDSLRKTLTTLRKQVGQMMSDYATDVEEQTRARMEQWNAQTQEFAKGMVAAVTAMNEILSEIDHALAQRREK